MDRLIICSHTSFLQSFRKSGVGVASSADIFSGSTVLDTQNSFSDQFTGASTEDVDTQNLVSLLVSQDLDNTISIIIGLSSRVGNEREGSLVVLDTYTLHKHSHLPAALSSSSVLPTLANSGWV
jgi:hypothetical protein